MSSENLRCIKETNAESVKYTIRNVRGKSIKIATSNYSTATSKPTPPSPEDYESSSSSKMSSSYSSSSSTEDDEIPF